MLTEEVYTHMMTCGHNSCNGEDCIADCPGTKPLYEVVKSFSGYIQVTEDPIENVETIPQPKSIHKMDKSQLEELATKLGISGIGTLTVLALKAAIKMAL